ncbi:hypothetical protein DFP73DRAFT_584009 [Morchella snyderi]|nr:hypothetical protein DFP73DRAFT_584009 [Morchella snyderi]
MNNPHRFTRQSALPQAKIQTKPQRDVKSADTIAPPTFASMLGRNLGGNTGTSGGVEDTISPIAFTTSFDLFSIAKVIPAKQRHVGNPISTTEDQTPDRTAFGEPSTENQSGDWPRYLPSAVGLGTYTPSQNQEVPKSMIFRRHGTASRIKRSIAHHRSDSTLQFNQGGDSVNDGQSKVVGIPARKNMNFYNGTKRNPLPNIFAEKETDKDFEEPEDTPTIEPPPTPGPPDLNPQGDSGIEREAELQKDQNPKDTINEIAGVTGSKSEPLWFIEHRFTAGAEGLEPFGSDFSHTTATKDMNDGGATLRAAARPFEPKQVKKDHFPSNAGIDEVSRNKLQSENFTNLSDKFYGKTFNPSGEAPDLPSKEQSQWFIENSHHRLQMAIQNSGNGSIGGSIMLGKKRASLSDAAISQLWDAPLSEANFTDSLNINQLDKNPLDKVINDKPGASIARGTPGPALQTTERLELRALNSTESKGDVTHKFHETLIDSFLQRSTTDINPTPELEGVGATSLRKTTENGFVFCNSDDGTFKRPTLEAQRKELTEAKDGEGWWKSFLEPTSDIEIQMRIEGNGCKEAERGWLYPYPKPEGKETIATELTLALYQQLLGYLIPAVSNGIVSEGNYWSFGARKTNSRYFSGREPWYTRDFTSFFDMSFGMNPGNRSTKATINPPPGLSLVPEGQQNRLTSEESVGLRDLVESSTPDLNNYIPGNYTTRDAKTLQEWNSTPINADIDASAKANKNAEMTRKSLINPPPWSESYGDGKGDSGITRGPSNSILNRESPKYKTLVQIPGTGSRDSIEHMLNMMHTDEDLKGPTAQQKFDVFGGARKMGKIVFGSDDESTA